ncbi:MAG: aldo/keto reductase [Candidatus Latescibacterota bacterium]|nr:aldo/keto reductase [Candidatus Latescibacterota bacterium]
MNYRELGKTGVLVSPVCLGTAFRSQEDEDTCVRVIERAMDLGCNFIDTALYGEGRSEKVVGRALKGRRGEIVLTTKIFATLGAGPNRGRLNRLNLMSGVEASLKRLGTDYIDLYLLHSFDPHTPLEVTLRALDDLVHQGKVRYIGCSNFAAWKMMEALWFSSEKGLAPFVCTQSQYNLLNRFEIEPEIMPLCREFGVGIMAYSPLAIGLLTGRFRRGQEPPAHTPWSRGENTGLSPHKYKLEDAMDEFNDRIVQTLVDIGERHHRSPAQVAIGWILDHPEISAPILGADEPEHVDEIFAGLEWALPAEERVLLDEVSERPKPRKFA